VAKFTLAVKTGGEQVGVQGAVVHSGADDLAAVVDPVGLLECPAGPGRYQGVQLGQRAARLAQPGHRGRAGLAVRVGGADDLPGRVDRVRLVVGDAVDRAQIGGAGVAGRCAGQRRDMVSVPAFQTKAGLPTTEQAHVAGSYMRQQSREGDVNAAARAELAKQRGEVVPHGTMRNPHPPGDLQVDGAQRRVPKNFALARREIADAIEAPSRGTRLPLPRTSLHARSSE
jgi:hypothetical protein